MDDDKKEELENKKEEAKQEIAKPSNVIDPKPEGPRVEPAAKPPVKDRKGLAIASMVLGIVALVLFCIWYISLPCAILSIVFGIISIKSSKKGMAIAGISTGAVGFVLMILLYVFVFFIIGVGTYSGMQDLIEKYEDNDYKYHYNYDLYDDYYDNDDWF